jgi:transposase
MRPPIKLELNKEQIAELQEVVKREKKSRTIERAKALLLRYKDVSVINIAFTLNVRSDTVYVWIRNYRKHGIKSLYEKEGRGRKSMFKDIPEEEIKALIDAKASIPIINANIKDKYGINVSNESVRKFVKKNFSLVLQE